MYSVHCTRYKRLAAGYLFSGKISALNCSIYTVTGRYRRVRGRIVSRSSVRTIFK